MATQYWLSLSQCQAAADPWNVQDVRSGSGTASSVSRHCVSTSKECQNTRGSCYLSANDADFFIATGDNPRAVSGDEDKLLSGWAPRKSKESRFHMARDGDNLLMSFECDFCIFAKLFDHEPQTNCGKNQFAMACIWRINLDAFWS